MNFSLLIPEFTAFGVLLFLLVREILWGSRKEVPQNTPWLTAIGGMLLVLASLFTLYGKTASGFSGTFVLDSFALFFKTLFAGIVLALLFMSREFFSARGGPASGGKVHTENTSEFLLILLSSLLGLFFLASANDFLLMFVALETFTLSLYVLAAYLKKDLVSIESGLKYLIMGSLASAFVIYGISLIFVATGSTSFLALRDAFSANPDSKLMLLAILLVIAGLGFKIASVPFQLWAPDVYEGAPTPVVAYLSTASKSAGFLLLMRFLFTAVPDFDAKRVTLFSALAAMTLLYGNLAALLQTNMKRLFGYSSISHAGYLLIGIAVGNEFGVTAVLYYLLGYMISNLAAFQVITLMGKKTGSEDISAYRGLGKRSPFLAGIFFISLLSLAGVPPLGGFFGKFLILLSAAKGGLDGLALLGALLVAVSLFYYLNIVRVMYFSAGGGSASGGDAFPASDETPIQVPASSKAALLLLTAGIILTGLFQAPFFAAVQQATKSLF